MGRRNSASNRVAGVSKSRHVRGRAFSLAATRSKSYCVNALIDPPFGTYCHNTRLVLALVPRCYSPCFSEFAPAWTCRTSRAVYVSALTVEKWLQRFRTDGVTGLQNRPSRRIAPQQVLPISPGGRR